MVELERSWEALKFKSFKLSRPRTKYMNCNFSEDVQSAETSIKI